jgi:hypothetical protein
MKSPQTAGSAQSPHRSHVPPPETPRRTAKESARRTPRSAAANGSVGSDHVER